LFYATRFPQGIYIYTLLAVMDLRKMEDTIYIKENELILFSLHRANRHPCLQGFIYLFHIVSVISLSICIYSFPLSTSDLGKLMIHKDLWFIDCSHALSV